MNEFKIFESEYKFCLILWEREPIGSMELVKLCKDTCAAEGIDCEVKNENAVVSALVSKEQVQLSDIEELMETRFEGNTPSFLSAFAKHKKLSDKQIAEIMEIINRAEE